VVLFLTGAVGRKIDIRNMSNDKDNHQLKQVIELLIFALSLDDNEIIRSTVESVIEILQEEINKQ